MDTNPTQSTNPTTSPQLQDQPIIDNKPIKQAIGPKINILSLLTILLLMGGLFAGLTLTQQNREIRSRATNTGPKLSLIPATKTVQTGQIATFNISLTTGTDTVSAVQLELSFDPTAADQVQYVNGTILPVVLKQAAVASGKLSVVLGVNPTSPYKGTGVLGSVKVRAKTAKTSNLAFTANTKTASIGKPSDTLASKVGSQIIATGTNITGTPTKTPTPTQPSGNSPTSSKTPTPTSSSGGSPTPTHTPTPTLSAGATNTPTPTEPDWNDLPMNTPTPTQGSFWSNIFNRSRTPTPTPYVDEYTTTETPSELPTDTLESTPQDIAITPETEDYTPFPETPNGKPKTFWSQIADFFGIIPQFFLNLFKK